MLTLYEHQREAVSFLKGRDRCCLADDQGLGKTISVAVAAKELGIKSIGVLAPAAALWNWHRELLLWAGHTAPVYSAASAALIEQGHSFITSHTMLLRDKVQQLARSVDLLVVDESQFFMRKDTKQESQRSRVLYRNVVPSVKRVWLLSGTPAPNGYACEMWSMLHHLWPDRFPEPFSAFRSTYCRLRATQYGDGWKPVANQNLPQLRDRMKGFMLRRLKKDVLTLPARRVETVVVKPTKMPPGLAELERKLRRRTQRAIGLDLVKAIESHDLVSSASTPAEAFQAMSSEEDMSRFRRLCGIAKVDVAVDLINAEFDNGLDCIVLFAHHSEVIKTLAAGLASHRPVIVDGSTNAAQRTAAVDAFQEGRANVFIGQLKAAGTAITLTRACEAMFIELSFTPGDNSQAADRIYRIGQTRPVRIRFLSLSHSIDELMGEVARNKVAMTQELMNR